MKRRFGIFWMFSMTMLQGFVLPATFQQALAQFPDLEPSNSANHQLSPEVVQRSGITRPGELPGLFLFMQSFSLDGYARRFSPFGYIGMEERGPLIVIDGQPQFLDVLGRAQYQLLPVSAGDVESVSLDTSPGINPSYRSPAGILNYRTKRPLGLSVRADLSVANEVDDPGPWRYTRFATRNIDRDGPRADFRLSYGVKKWFARLALLTDDHHVTDERLNERIWSVYAGATRPHLTLFSPSGYFEYKAESMRHRVRLGSIVYRDMFFMDTAGREIPMRQSWRYATASGYLAVGEKITIDYLLDHRTLNVTGRPTRLPFGPALRGLRTTASIGVLTQGETFHLKFSGGLSLRQLRPSSVESLTRVLGTSLDVGWNRGKKLSHELSTRFALALSDGPDSGWIGKGFRWRVNWRPDHRKSLHLTLSLDERLPSESRDLPDLLQRHAALPVPSLSSYSIPEVVVRSRLFLVQLNFDLRLSRTLSGRLTGRYRMLQGLTLPDYERNPIRDTRIYDTVTGYSIGQTGRVYTAGLELDSRLGKSGQVVLGYFHSHPSLNNGRLFNSATAPVIRHRIGVRAHLAPFPGTTLFANGSWNSGSRWPSYSFDPESTTGHFWRSEVAVAKSVWDHRFEIILTGRNIDNPRTPEHPAGAVERLTFQVTIRSRISHRN